MVHGFCGPLDPKAPCIIHCTRTQAGLGIDRGKDRIFSTLNTIKGDKNKILGLFAPGIWINLKNTIASHDKNTF